MQTELHADECILKRGGTTMKNGVEKRTCNEVRKPTSIAEEERG
jgi:hypothetical protein